MKRKVKEQEVVEWTTVAVVNRLYEAMMIKSVLEEDGLLVFLKGENTAQTYVDAIGGFQVQVPANDAEYAYGLLIEGEFING